MFYVGLKEGIPFLTDVETECPHTMKPDGSVKFILSDDKSNDDGVKLFTTSEPTALRRLRTLKVVPKKKVSVPKKKGAPTA